MQVKTMNKIKLGLGLLLAAVFVSFLIVKTTRTGSHTERCNWEMFLIQRGCDPIEYEELYLDCVAIKHILERMLDYENRDLLGEHLNAYLCYSVDTVTSHILYADMLNIDFDI